MQEQYENRFGSNKGTIDGDRARDQEVPDTSTEENSQLDKSKNSLELGHCAEKRICDSKVQKSKVFVASESKALSSKDGHNSSRVKPGVSMQYEVQLHKAQYPWKSSTKEEKISSDSEISKSEDLLRKIKGILNRLTPTNFRKLVKKMAELPIDTEQKLKDVTFIIFETAISQPMYAIAYASMCRYLTQLKVPSSKASGGFVNFRAILLTLCQKEFEGPERKDGIKETGKAEDDHIKILQEEAELERRQLGFFRLLGEVFKLKMLTETIMHDCVLKLLRSKDEESYMNLSVLLSVIGESLDTEKAKPRMDQYFHQIRQVVLEKKIQFRVRFMLQDILDLRENKWVSKRQLHTPKTIDAIHKEVALEQQKRKLMAQKTNKWVAKRQLHAPKTIDASQTEVSLQQQSQKVKMEDTERSGSKPTAPTAIPMEKVQEKLINLLTKRATNEEVFDWIKANLDDRATKTKKFMKVLMTAVCSSAISSGGKSIKVDPREVKNRGGLLQKYLDHRAEFELQALYALQALVHQIEHPPGVLRTLFDTLYDEDIISEDAFNQWEKSSDPAEQDGKFFAMRQVIQFFTWLRDAEDSK